MKVTIDTKEDEFEDIKKVLGILTHILESKKQENKVIVPTDTTDMMEMFNSESKEDVVEKPEKAPDFSSFIKLAKTPKKESFDSNIELY